MTGINAEMAVGGIVRVTSTIARSGGRATRTTLSLYRFDDNGNTSQIASDTVDLNPPFQMSDLPPRQIHCLRRHQHPQRRARAEVTMV